MSRPEVLKLRVTGKEQECAGVYSLYLSREDGAPLPECLPGQFLAFELEVPGQARPLIRCYSLSDAPRPDRWRITVKDIGVGSGYIASGVQPGDVLSARPPAGSFVLDPRGTTPVVLLGGGIGITPLLGMLNAQVAAGSGREVRLFLGMRNGQEHPFREHLIQVARDHPEVRLRVLYSRPLPEDVEGRDYDRAGRVTPELLQEELPPSDRPYDFYVCGPAAMMDALSQGLRDLGIPDSRVHLEAFGAATVKPFTRRLTRRLKRTGRLAGASVTFERAGKTVPWDPQAGSLLDFAMANDVFFPFACAAGHCGTCTTRLVSGEVRYPMEPQFPIRPGICLPCIATPDGSVTLDV